MPGAQSRSTVPEPGVTEAIVGVGSVPTVAVLLPAPMLVK